jgi:Carboxypeptidase regulatory-like domain
VSHWTDWEITRHQVAVAGRVVDESDKPVTGAQVTLTLLPKEGRQKSSHGGTDQQELNPRCGQTFTKADGVFFFLDSPAGEYSVECVNSRSDLHVNKTVSVSWQQDGTVKRATADLKLSKA